PFSRGQGVGQQAGECLVGGAGRHEMAPRALGRKTNAGSPLRWFRPLGHGLLTVPRGPRPSVGARSPDRAPGPTEGLLRWGTVSSPCPGADRRSPCAPGDAVGARSPDRAPGPTAPPRWGTVS